MNGKQGAITDSESTTAVHQFFLVRNINDLCYKYSMSDLFIVTGIKFNLRHVVEHLSRGAEFKSLRIKRRSGEELNFTCLGNVPNGVALNPSEVEEAEIRTSADSYWYQQTLVHATTECGGGFQEEYGFVSSARKGQPPAYTEGEAWHS